MALAKRERLLVIGTVAVVGLLGLDQYLLTPVLDAEDQLQNERQQIVSDMTRAQSVMSDRKAAMARWRTMVRTGLKSDPAEAEGQLLHALRDWAKESGLVLSSVKPERPESKDTQLREIQVQASANGTMEALTKFMLKVQQSAFPLKLSEFQMASRNESTNDIALQIKVSTLYKGAAPAADSTGKSSSPAAEETQ